MNWYDPEILSDMFTPYFPLFLLGQWGIAVSRPCWRH